MRRVLAVAFAFLLALAALPGSAEADLVFLRSGRTLSVKAIRVEGGQAILSLRGGGEAVCDAALVERVSPDEVPYPEEPPATAVEADRPVTAVPFAELIEPLAALHQVDARLVRAVVEVESAYVPTARSRKGAMGLMQLMPATARQYALNDPYDPGKNLEAGIRHLRALLDRYEIRLALAAYNAGEAAVVRYGGVPPFPETRDYVSRVLKRAALAKGVGGQVAASPATSVPVTRARS